MKNILITGANSYIGTSFEKWLKKYPEKYKVDTIDMIGDRWRQKSFAGYDVVFHVAGIVHVKETKKNKELYYKINRDLAYETANKAKEDGVKQFIFMSSMSVYGMQSGVINKDTPLNPKTSYGKSKLQAELLLGPMSNENFRISILRPPMVYGEGCKGNYSKLVKLVQKLPIFPDIDNIRSMLHIDNLCEFVRIIIDNEEFGLFFPQNDEYINTSELVKIISKEVHGKKIKLTKIFNPILKSLLNRVRIVNKVFGDLVYEKSMSDYCKANYRIRKFEELIDLRNWRAG